MGNTNSMLPGLFAALPIGKNTDKLPPPQLVLVPPMFERDVRGRSRMAKNSYDYLFGKRDYRWLFSDFVSGVGPQAALYLSPPADESLYVRAKIGMATSSMTLRYQPYGPDVRNVFFEVKAKPEGAGRPQVASRACYFDTASGWGVFATAPLAQSGKEPPVSAGLRYSSPTFTAGGVLAPAYPTAGPGSLSSAWLVSRVQGVTFGLKINPDAPGLPLAGAKGARSREWSTAADEARSWLWRNSSMAVSYTPEKGAAGGVAGRHSFTACMEIVRGAALVTSFHQHLAVTRKVLIPHESGKPVVNPMEAADVVGITNYIDVGLKLVTPLHVGSTAAAASYTPPSTYAQAAAAPAEPAAAVQKERRALDAEGLEPGLNIAVAWQANKNWLVKGRIGNTSAAAAVGFRAWFHPSFLVFATVQLPYGAGPGNAPITSVTNAGPTGSEVSWTKVPGTALRWGLVVQVENFGPLRYERGSQEGRGRALLQRHEASTVDITNAQGSGRFVVKDAGVSQYNVQELDRTAELL